MRPATILARNPRRLLALLTTVNFLNYIDRQALFAVFPAIQGEFHLSDGQLGFLGSAFIVVYMVNAPLAGYLGDRFRRLPIVAASAALWSLFTLLTGFARDFTQLFLCRAGVGVGESAYAPASSALIADSFPEDRRGSRLAVFNLAVPVGSALGYLLGGLFATWFGWRAAFAIVGVPGIGLALICLLLTEPERGEQDSLCPPSSPFPEDRELLALLSNPVYLASTAAMAALTFVLGAIAVWMPTFLVRIHGLSLGAAGTSFGLLTVLAGLAGTAAGGWLGDRARRRHPAGYLWVSAAGLLAAAPLTWVAVQASRPVLFWTAAALAETLVFLNTGPLNAVIVSVAGPQRRAIAVGANVLLIHLFGDALSPWLLGSISDRFGIRTALSAAPPMLLASGLCCLLGGRMISARARRRLPEASRPRPPSLPTA